jgi:hypothetical protein
LSYLIVLGSLTTQIHTLCTSKLSRFRTTAISLKQTPSISSTALLNLEGILVNGVSIANIDGLRGIIAATPTSAKTPVVEVNSELVLQVTNTREPCPFPNFCSVQLWDNLKWDERLAMKLLHLKHFTTDSPLSTWITELPRSFSTPLTWSEDQINSLQYDVIFEKIKMQKSKWKTLYDTWYQEASAEAKKQVTYEEMIWALQCINSRAFSGPYEGSTAQDRRALVSFTGLLTLIWPLAGLGTYEQSISAAFIVVLSIFLRDIISLRVSSLKR